MRRFASLILAAIFACLGIAHSAAPSSLPAVPDATYTCDGPQHSVVLTNSTSERGPPARTYDPTTLRAVDRQLHGTSARPEIAASHSCTTYEAPVLLAPAARAMGATRGSAQATSGDLLPPRQSRVAAKTVDDWPVLSGIVRDAGRGKGNFGVGSGTASQATRAGESWVGEGYRIASDGKTLVSRDGLKTFRPPSWKPDLGKYQANFSYWIGERAGRPFGNGHLDITDMGP